MDGIREFLEAVRQNGLLPEHLRGMLHAAIGRRIARADGTVLSAGLTWRELSTVLRDLRFDREFVREFGTDPDDLPPRDRQRFWYGAIAAARVDSAQAHADADRLTRLMKPLGYIIGAPPSATDTSTSSPPVPTPPPPSSEPTEKPKRKR